VEDLGQHPQYRLGPARVDEIARGLAHEADPFHVEELADPEEEPAGPDEPAARVVLREDDAKLLHLLDLRGARGGPQDPGRLHQVALGEAGKGVELPNAHTRDQAQDPLGELVLPFGGDALVVPAEEDEVTLLRGLRLSVGELLSDEPDRPVLVDVDLRREELRVDGSELRGS
jgi:hypothetical protein